MSGAMPRGISNFSGWEAARTLRCRNSPRSALITYPQFCNNFVMITSCMLTSLGSDRALKVLKDGLVEAIVMNNRFLTTSPEMVVEVLYDEPIEVLMAANHPLAQYEWVPWSGANRYPPVFGMAMVRNAW